MKLRVGDIVDCGVGVKKRQFGIVLEADGRSTLVRSKTSQGPYGLTHRWTKRKLRRVMKRENVKWYDWL